MFKFFNKQKPSILDSFIFNYKIHTNELNKLCKKYGYNGRMKAVNQLTWKKNV